MIHGRATVVLALMVLVLAGCASTPATSQSSTPVTVVTSTNVYGAIVKAVGGDRVTVDSLVTEPSADPHSYEATPADAAKVARARLVVFNGGGYDDFVPRLVASSGTDVAVLEATQVAGIEPTPPEEPTSPDAHDEQNSDNEHVWYDLSAMQRLAERIAEQLTSVDPAGAATYSAGADRFTAAVGELLTRVEGIAARHRGTRIAATEPLAAYLVEDAGLVDATPEEFVDAVADDAEPPAAAVAETLDLFTNDPVRLLIVNPQTATPTTEHVRHAAEAAGVPVVSMTETLPEGVDDYVSWMRTQIDALSAALDRP